MDAKVRFATTVGELREALKNLSDETLVVQARDEEGNGFLPLMGVESGFYSPEADELLSADCAAYLTPKSHPVVCLWPAHDWQHAQMIADARYPHKKK